MRLYSGKKQAEVCQTSVTVNIQWDMEQTLLAAVSKESS